MYRVTRATIYQWPCLAWARGRYWQLGRCDLTYTCGCWCWCWSTPWLVIHSSMDCRLPQTDGIGAFHALNNVDIFPCRGDLP
ncbi:hypothetical protein BJV78DRAFT_1204536 [Lactifluus subvellereus]|nr:hypothetical protein BJV78DRAFT_1204536 [Lactifluus subvellereus]